MLTVPYFLSQPPGEMLTVSYLLPVTAITRDGDSALLTSCHSPPPPAPCRAAGPAWLGRGRAPWCPAGGHLTTGCAGGQCEPPARRTRISTSPLQVSHWLSCKVRLLTLDIESFVVSVNTKSNSESNDDPPKLLFQPNSSVWMSITESQWKKIMLVTKKA